MNAIMAASEHPPVASTSEGEEALTSGPGPGIRLNAYAVIFSLASILALATASECQSVTHLPSLVYGVVLWEWWGLIASIVWKLGQRFPSVSSFSVKTISLHVLVGLVLGLLHLLLLWSLGFTSLGWQGSETPQSEWQRLLNVNRFGIELLIYGFVFGIVGNHSVSHSSPARCHEIAGIAEATLRVASACLTDAA